MLKRPIIFTAILIIYIMTLHFSLGGDFAYALDDPYIHLSIAKNIASDGVWGVTPYEFSAASSSLLYSCMLAFLITIFGLCVYYPLILNTAAFFLILVFVERTYFKDLIEKQKLAYSAAFVFFVPLIANVINGMEHLFQILFCSACLYFSLNFDSKNKYKILLPISGFFAVAARYESIFIIFPIALYLWFNRLKFEAFILLCASIIAPVAFGIISLANGSGFLPNTLIIKGTMADGSLSSYTIYLYKWILKFIEKKQMIPVAGILIFAIIALRGKNEYKKMFYTAHILLFALVAHMNFADVGWFFRYEAYLIALTVLVIPSVIASTNNKTILTLLSLCFVVLSFRSFSSFNRIYTVPEYILNMQAQTGRFVRDYIKSDCLACGDIGAICYYSEIPIYDMNGLAHYDAAIAIKEKRYDIDFITTFAKNRNVKFAIIYDTWDEMNFIPKHWIKVANWSILDPLTGKQLGFDFYSVDSTGAVILKENLFKFDANHKSIVNKSYY